MRSTALRTSNSRRWLLALLLSATALGCDRTTPAPARPAAPRVVGSAQFPRAAEGQRLMEQFECARCHVVEQVTTPPVTMDCRGCHRAIIERSYPEAAEYLERWDKNLVHMRDVPSLIDAQERWHRSWFIDFVTKPRDLRPRLGATMPRLSVTTDEAAAMADFLGLTDLAPQAPGVGAEPEQLRLGREILDTRGCGSCHTMSGSAPLIASPIPVPMEPARLASAMLLAPDLGEVDGRMPPDRIAAWLLDPRSMKRDALMPAVGLTQAEADAVATYLTSAPQISRPAPPEEPSARPAALGREVRWGEVSTKVFEKICLHCHSDPAYNEGDGGPGNTGGFGFPGKQLDFSTYERAVYGTEGGKVRRTIFEPDSSGTPRIVAHMLARHDEVAGFEREGVLGMPLGFPPMSIKEIQLVDAWVVSGLLE